MAENISQWLGKMGNFSNHRTVGLKLSKTDKRLDLNMMRSTSASKPRSEGCLAQGQDQRNYFFFLMLSSSVEVFLVSRNALWAVLFFFKALGAVGRTRGAGLYTHTLFLMF